VSAVVLLLAAVVTVSGPRDTTSTRPVYRFAGAARFLCAFDSPKLVGCPSRYSRALAAGAHVLRVQGVANGRRTKVVRVGVIVRVPVTGGDVAASGPDAPTIAVGDQPFGVAAAASSIWSANYGDGLSSLWVANYRTTVTRIDPATGLVLARIDAGPRPTDVAIGAGGVWVCNYGFGTITKIDPATNRKVATIRVGGNPNAIVATDDAVFVGEQAGNTLSRVDPATSRVTLRVPTDRDPDNLLLDGGSLWASAYYGGTVTRYDLATLRPTARIRVGGPEGMAVAAGSLWVGSYDGNQLVRVDPSARRAVGATRTGTGVRQVVAAFGGLWTADSTAGSISRVPVP
jgi:YVTN family beta-propeller protein